MFNLSITSPCLVIPCISMLSISSMPILNPSAATTIWLKLPSFSIVHSCQWKNAFGRYRSWLDCYKADNWLFRGWGGISVWLFYSECLKWYVSSFNVPHKMAAFVRLLLLMTGLTPQLSNSFDSPHCRRFNYTVPRDKQTTTNTESFLHLWQDALTAL